MQLTGCLALAQGLLLTAMFPVWTVEIIIVPSLLVACCEGHLIQNKYTLRTVPGAIKALTKWCCTNGCGVVLATRLLANSLLGEQVGWLPALEGHDHVMVGGLPHHFHGGCHPAVVH